MSCAHPFLMSFTRYGTSYNEYIPCGYCLNCRVDKQNQLVHRCEQELINYKCGAFVTLTYDDLHIIDNLRHDSSGKLNATLNREDFRKYMYRLRANIKNRMPDTILSNHHFKFLAVGEYGQDGQIFDRPHIHILLFGLDFAYCKKEIERAWQGRGMIKCLPILNGGIAYVLKYLDKQLFGKQAEQKYDNNNLERPYQVHSLSLGSSLYKNQKSYINLHNGCYRWKGKDYPVPPYYKNKYYFNSFKYINQARTINEYKTINGCKPKNIYDLHDFSIRQALLREENINVKNHLHGRPRYDYMAINKLKTVSKQYINNISTQAILAAYEVPF